MGIIGTQISNSIRESANIVAREVHRDFYLLDSKLEEMNSNILIGNQERDELLKELLSESNLSNQLQKKANEKSEKLMNDINYIKTREEYRQMKF